MTYCGWLLIRVLGFISSKGRAFLKWYEEIFCYGWAKTGVLFEGKKPIPLIHEEIKPEAGSRADIIINNKVVVELKSVEALAPVHYKQVQTYLKLTGCKPGLLVNFNINLIKDSIQNSKQLIKLCALAP